MQTPVLQVPQGILPSRHPTILRASSVNIFNYFVFFSDEIACDRACAKEFNYHADISKSEHYGFTF